MERGSVLRFTNKYQNLQRKRERIKKKRRIAAHSTPDILDGLHQRFGRCTSDYNSNDEEDDDEEERIETTNMNSNNTHLNKNRRGPSTPKNKGRGTSTTNDGGSEED